MTRDDFLCITRISKPGLPLAQNGAVPGAPRGTAPPTCCWLFCDKPATEGDLCGAHWELSKDLREEYDFLREELER